MTIQDDIDPKHDEKISELEKVRQDVENGEEPRASVRELLRWFGASRRRTGVVERIERELEATGLRTDPHFTTTWIDAPVIFRKRGADTDPNVAVPALPGQQGEPELEPDGVEKSGEIPEMTHLVRMLDAANRKVLSVNPQDPIEKAVTLMLAHDFSQLAVMTGPRDLKGVISWKSIGSRLSQRNKLTQVRDAMERASVVLDTDSLFEATRTIVDRMYVFVRSSTDHTISGIVTATDLSEQFHKLSEPFLLLGRIENQIRLMIQPVCDRETLRAACIDNDPDRKAEITSVSQLTFGEYQRIIENEANWGKLRFFACRKTFCKELDDVRKLRNEIMHFHPDDIEPEDLGQLRRFSRLLEQLERLSN